MSRLDFTFVFCNTFIGLVKLYGEAVRQLFRKNYLLQMVRLPFTCSQHFFFFFFFYKDQVFLGNERVFVWEANCRSDNCKKVHYAPLFLLPQFCSFLTLAKKERKILIKKKPKSVHFSVKLMCSSFSDFSHFT